MAFQVPSVRHLTVHNQSLLLTVLECRHKTLSSQEDVDLLLSSHTCCSRARYPRLNLATFEVLIGELSSSLHPDISPDSPSIYTIREAVPTHSPYPHSVVVLSPIPSTCPRPCHHSPRVTSAGRSAPGSIFECLSAHFLEYHKPSIEETGES